MKNRSAKFVLSISSALVVLLVGGVAFAQGESSVEMVKASKGFA